MAEEAEEIRDHEKKLAIIEARKIAFARSPFWFTVWDWGAKIIGTALWLGFWFLLAQCTCDGCITK